MGIEKTLHTQELEFKNKTESILDTLTRQNKTIIQAPDEFFKDFPGRDNIPVFETVYDFLSSDMYSKYYDLWEKELRGRWYWGIEWEWDQIREIWPNGEVISLRPRPIPKENRATALRFQRMLLALWYLQQEDLNLDIQRGSWSDIRETDLVRIWKLWQKDFLATKKLQADYGLRKVDGIVWVETKILLYTLMFELYHKK